MVSRGKQGGAVPGHAGTHVPGGKCPFACGCLLLLCHPRISWSSHRTGICTPEPAEAGHSSLAAELRVNTGFEVHLRCGTMRNFQETWKAPETAAGDCPRNVGQVLLLVTEMFLSAQ